MSKLPKVIIVGRVNVGKSTLFNRLSSEVKSLTFDYAGVTRDFIKDTVCWQNKCFDLIDTGGISLRKTSDPIAEAVRLKALDLLQESDIILLVCDGKVGVVEEDREISKLLHKLNKKVLVAVNKIDSTAAKENIYEFERLGHKELLAVSAQHAIGVGDLLESIVANLPKYKEPKEEKKGLCKVVLLGKPNVGKSSLMNLLLQEERSIVSQEPGTTREAISEKITFYKEDILVTDTAGIRRKRAVDEPLEKFMVKSSFRALEDSDIVLLLVDASEGRLSDQELKLAFYAFENYKALIILFNKWDLVDEYVDETLKFNLEPYNYFMKRVERLNISCKDGTNIGKILPKIETVFNRYSQNFSEEEIDFLLKDALKRKPLYHKTIRLSLRNARQVATAPVTILLTVNFPQWFGPSQLGFFENVLRKKFNFKGVPIKFIVRKRK